MKHFVQLHSSDVARRHLDELGWIAQRVTGTFRELTGHFFIQGHNVRVSIGVDTLAAWTDPIPVLKEVISDSTRAVTVEVDGPATVYSALTVGSLGTVAPASATPALLTPSLLGANGWLWAEIMPRNLGGYTNRPICPLPWLYKATTGMSYSTTVDGIVTPDFLASCSFIPGASVRSEAPVIIPLNGDRSNINTCNIVGGAMNTFSSYTDTARMSLSAFYNAAGGTNLKPWYVQGTIDAIYTTAGTTIVLAFVEVPGIFAPVRGFTGGTAATPLTSAVVRAIFMPFTLPGVAGSPSFGFRFCGFCPGWVPAAGNTVCGTVLYDSINIGVGWGAMVGNYAAVTPLDAYPTRDTVRVGS